MWIEKHAKATRLQYLKSNLTAPPYCLRDSPFITQRAGKQKIVHSIESNQPRAGINVFENKSSPRPHVTVQAVEERRLHSRRNMMKHINHEHHITLRDSVRKRSSVIQRKGDVPLRPIQSL